MRTEIFAALVLISLFVSGCAFMSGGYVKPGLDIRDEKVGLEVINSVRLAGSIKSEILSQIKEPIEKTFLYEIKASTLYKIKTVSGVNSCVGELIGKMPAEEFISQVSFKEAIKNIGRENDVKYMVLVYICDFGVDYNNIHIEFLIQIVNTESVEMVFENKSRQQLHIPSNNEVRSIDTLNIGSIVAHFPGYLTPQSGHDLAEDFKWLDVPVVNTPDQSDYPNASAIFLVYEVGNKVNLKPATILTALSKYGNFYTTTTQHVAIKILNERGYAYANMVIPFDSGTHIENIEARTIKKDGSIVKLANDQIYEVTMFPEFIFFSDAKAKKFTMPSVEPGCIVEYMYTVVSESVALWGTFEFQQAEPLLLSKFSLDVPMGMEYSREFLCADSMPDRFKKFKDSIDDLERQGGYRESRFSNEVRDTKQYVLKDVPPIEPEENMPPWNELVARLNFSSVTFGGDPYLAEWKDIGNWYASLISKSLKPNASIRQKAKAITQDKKSVEEKARAIYNYIQENFRYVAVELGIGNIVPQSSEEVEKCRYGDCKGLSALLISMLHSVEVDAYPAILRTKDIGKLDEKYVAFSQLNHMIVCIENKEKKIWLDPSVGSCAFLSLPWQDQDVKALVVKPDHSYLDTTPISEAEDNLVKNEWEINLQPDGRLTCQVKKFLKGQLEFFYRASLGQLSENEQRNWINQSIAQIFPQAQLMGYKCDKLKEKDAPLDLSYQFEVSNILQKTGDLLLFSLPLRPAITTFNQKKRVYSIIFDYPFHQVDEMRIYLPEGYTVDDLPEPVDLQTQYGKLKISLTKHQDFILYRWEVVWNATNIPASQYEDLFRFQQESTAVQYNNIILRKSATR